MSDWPRGRGPSDRIERLYDEHAAGLYRYALMILADGESAGDVVQQVFLRLVSGAADGAESTIRLPAESAAVSAYLLRAVRNECYSVLRGHERRQIGIEQSHMIEPVDPGGDPAERVLVEQALRALPPEQREVVHLKIFEGRTFQEIADLTGESINTAASRYRYAIEKLKGLLSS
jgi:RNA polymerase sigma-70 factor (ECF subfamily)